MENSATVSFDSVSMLLGKATIEGGAIYASGSGISSLTLLNCPSTLSYFESAQDGGFMYITLPDLAITTTNCSWNNLLASSRGGLIYGD